MLPSRYAWLTKEPGPKMLLAALADYGTIEVPGKADNPKILGWARDLGIKDYVHDSIPWCSLAMSHWAHVSGYEIPKRPLWALDWANWGNKSERPMLGDILVYKRAGGGHVNIYVGEDSISYHGIGGNQTDSVNITRISKVRLYAARRCPWKVAQPENVRVVHLAPSGTLSTNEA